MRLRSFSRRSAAFIASVAIFGSVASVNAQHPRFTPAIANPFEARISTLFQPGPKHLRLDIGYRFDVVSIPVADSVNSPIVLDGEFFTLTRLRSEGNFKFPVETIDYWFGLGFHYVHRNTQLRVRIAHISSHLVDGFADASGTFSQQLPFVYSREFIEVNAAHSIGAVRPYVGITYAWATLPRSFNKLIPQAGFDFRVPFGVGSIVGGADARFVGINDTYGLSANTQIGYSFAGIGANATSVSLARFDGRSIHGMFAHLDDHYWALAVQVVF